MRFRNANMAVMRTMAIKFAVVKKRRDYCVTIRRAKIQLYDDNESSYLSSALDMDIRLSYRNSVIMSLLDCKAPLQRNWAFRMKEPYWLKALTWAVVLYGAFAASSRLYICVSLPSRRWSCITAGDPKYDSERELNGSQ